MLKSSNDCGSGTAGGGGIGPLVNVKKVVVLSMLAVSPPPATKKKGSAVPTPEEMDPLDAKADGEATPTPKTISSAERSDEMSLTARPFDALLSVGLGKDGPETEGVPPETPKPVIKPSRSVT